MHCLLPILTWVELLLALFHRSLEKPNNCAKGHEGTFGGNGNLLYLNRGGGYTGIYI